MHPPDLSIVMVNRNSAEITARALNALAVETLATRFEVIIADVSDTAALEQTAGQHPLKPRIIRMPAETTAARATTAAARFARGTHILLVDTHAVVTDGAIDKLFAFAKANPTARIWTGRQTLRDGSLRQPSCWQRMTLWNMACRAVGLTGLRPASLRFNSEAYGGWKRDDTRQVDIVTGSFFLIDRELWDGLRGYDPIFAGCGEDADLCLRARAFSARPLFTPTATIIYDCADDSSSSVAATVAMLDAKATLISRHWPRPAVGLGQVLLTAWPLTRAIATSAWAVITGSKHAGQLAARWREVWQRRSEWKPGRHVPEIGSVSMTAATRLAQQ